MNEELQPDVNPMRRHRRRDGRGAKRCNIHPGVKTEWPRGSIA
jgi:hypothetical protein